MKGDYVSPSRRISVAFGALYLITFITSIPALILFQPVLDDPMGYIAGAGADNRIYLGALLELILIIANIGTAVVLMGNHPSSPRRGVRFCILRWKPGNPEPRRFHIRTVA
jgi:hypothetical protein